MSAQNKLAVFTGNAHPQLAADICHHLDIPPGKAEVFQFPNENIFVKIRENVRGRDVFVVQPLTHPVNTSIMELLIMLDALKRASAQRVTAVVPYYGYGRTDKKDQPRVPITARLIADCLSVAGAQRLLTMDLHAGQIQGFFNIPVDELTAKQILTSYMRQKDIAGLTVVATDAGFAKKARNIAESLNAPLAIVEKRRIGNNSQTEAMSLIGSLVGRAALVVDDEIDTAGTMVQAVRVAREHGAQEVYVCASHGVLSGPAVERLAEAGIKELILTDSVPLPEEKRLPCITTLSIAGLFARAIQRIHQGRSVSRLFNDEESGEDDDKDDEYDDDSDGAMSDD
jgi:ribose-phosphate pyrophosphokinase